MHAKPNAIVTKIELRSAAVHVLLWPVLMSDRKESFETSHEIETSAVSNILDDEQRTAMPKSAFLFMLIISVMSAIFRRRSLKSSCGLEGH